MRKEELSEGLIVGARPPGAGWTDARSRLKAKVIEFGIADDGDTFRTRGREQKRHARVEIVEDEWRTRGYYGEDGESGLIRYEAGHRYVLPHADLDAWTAAFEAKRQERTALYGRHDRVRALLTGLGLVERKSSRFEENVPGFGFSGEKLTIDLDAAEPWLKSLAGVVDEESS